MVTQAAAPQGKHIPQRTCLGCRATKPKRDLTRIVSTAEGRVLVDATGKARGRGAYFCPNSGCAKRALTARTLSRALRISIDGAALTELREWAERLSETPRAPTDTR